MEEPPGYAKWLILVLALIGWTTFMDGIEGRPAVRLSGGARHLANVRHTRQASRLPDWYEGATQLANAVFAARGQTVVIPCAKQSAGALLDAEYTWTDRKQQPLVDSRYAVKETGDLEVKDVQPEDSGSFECHAKHSVEGEEREIKHKHHLLEYILPSYQEQAVFVYGVSLCADALPRGKEGHLKRQLCPPDQTTACVYHFNSTCHSVREQDEAGGYRATHEVWITISVSPDNDFQPPTCDATCMKKATLVNINKNYGAVLRVADSEIAAARTVFAFNPKKMVKRTIHKCTAGYRPYGSVVCLPCEPGSFSKDGVPELCTKCPANRYQDRFAMTDCFPCPNNGTTDAEGSISTDLCKVAGVLKLSIDMNNLKSKEMEGGLIAGGILGVMAIGAGVAFGLMWRNRNQTKKRKEAHRTDPDFVELHNSIRQQKSSQNRLSGAGSRLSSNRLTGSGSKMSNNRLSKLSLGNRQPTSKTSAALHNPLVPKRSSRDAVTDDGVPIYLSMANIPSRISKLNSRHGQEAAARSSSHYRRSAVQNVGRSLPHVPPPPAPPVPGGQPYSQPRNLDDKTTADSLATSPGYESMRSRNSGYEHPTGVHQQHSRKQMDDETPYANFVRPTPHYPDPSKKSRSSVHAQAYPTRRPSDTTSASYEFPVLDPPGSRQHSAAGVSKHPTQGAEDDFTTLVDVLNRRRKTLAPDTDDDRELREKSSASIARRVSSTSDSASRGQGAGGGHAFSPYK